MRVAAVVNPRAGGGRCERLWQQLAPQVQEVFPSLRVYRTQAPGAGPAGSESRLAPAAAATVAALQDGHELVIAVGGDGTFNEAVNGYMHHGAAGEHSAALSVLMVGTGGDFVRNFTLPQSHSELLRHIGDAPVRSLDVGRVRCVSDRGDQINRYFINIASFGLSGAVTRDVNRRGGAGRWGGQVTFAQASLAAGRRFTPQPVTLTVDAQAPVHANITTVAVANGRYFGGAMMVAPDARPDDGQLDVTVIAETTWWQMLGWLPRLYRGAHLGHPKVSTARGARVHAQALGGEPVLIETDGEPIGQLPASFEVLPGALALRL